MQLSSYVLPKTAGIYAIVNTVNNKIYIGSSINLRARMSVHRWTIRANKHHSTYLQNAYRAHGEDVFEVHVLQHINGTDDLIEREQHWINKLKPEYNMTKVAGVAYNTGRKLTDEHRAKISAGGKGKKRSDETRARMSAAQLGGTRGKGIPKSDEHKAAASAAMKGRVMSDESRAKMSESAKRRVAEGRNKNLVQYRLTTTQQ